jgi:putative transposase
MTESCRLCHISRKTGYKWLRRFLAQGRLGLRDRPRRPKRSPRRTSWVWLRRIQRIRRRQQHWGAKKIRAYLRRRFPRRKLPAVRTMTRWLERWRLTRPGRRRPPRGPRVERGQLTEPRCSNHVWTVDFKGWFRTGDGRRVEPLTVRDLFSRYILAIRLLPDQQWWRVRAVFVRLMRRYGRPRIIRADNGFGSNGPAGLSRLSAWWTALGIRVEFIAPGHPEQNGGHEQMHRMFKAQVVVRVSHRTRAQQRRTHRWVRHYNWERPHEALGQRLPGEVYRPGSPAHGNQWNWRYPRRWAVRHVRSNGQIRWQGRLRFIGEAFVGMKVGLQPLDRRRRKVYLNRVMLGELRADDLCGLRPAVYVRTATIKKAKV